MRKNLVYVFADQWRFHAMGCSREDDVCTPFMDSFASDSLVCTGAVSSYPLCSPHRAALMTGKHPLSCGMWTNCKTGLNEKICLSPDEITIHDVLHDAGSRLHMSASGIWMKVNRIILLCRTPGRRSGMPTLHPEKEDIILTSGTHTVP